MSLSLKKVTGTGTGFGSDRVGIFPEGLTVRTHQHPTLNVQRGGLNTESHREHGDHRARQQRMQGGFIHHEKRFFKMNDFRKPHM